MSELAKLWSRLVLIDVGEVILAVLILAVCWLLIRGRT